MPIGLHNKRLDCKSVKKHFDSAKVMVFHLFAFHYLGQPRKILRGRQEGKKKEKDRKWWWGGGICACVCACVQSLIASNFLTDWVKRCADGAGY